MRLHNLPDEASEDISDQRMQIAGVFVQSSWSECIYYCKPCQSVYLSVFAVKLRNYRIDFYYIIYLGLP
jgi:hypothetical protein